MAAFDRVCSGIPQMDQVFDNIRLGDKVVWRLTACLDSTEKCAPSVLLLSCEEGRYAHEYKSIRFKIGTKL